jgi:putative ABC transport system permease protein
MLTSLGTVVGVGAFATSIGLATTARAQVITQFNALKATEIIVQDTQPQSDTLAFPPDTEQEADRINGVVSSGVFWQLPTLSLGVSKSFVSEGSSATPPGVLAASPGLFKVAEAQMQVGRPIEAVDQAHGVFDAVLGSEAATDLGIDSLQDNPSVLIDGVPFLVVGIIKNVQREPEMELSVIVPENAALDLWGLPTSQPAETVIATRLGAAQVVAEQAAVAIDPADPERLLVSSPPSAAQLQGQVSGSISGLILLIGLVGLVIGVIGITSSTLLSVLERTSEIGLRRALGGTRWAVGGQILLETTAIGTAGGLVGTCLAVITVVAVAKFSHWVAVLTPLAILPDPLIGAATGLVAGILPALRAARLDPAEALRR